jgi:hypothetical protein
MPTIELGDEEALVLFDLLTREITRKYGSPASLNIRRSFGQ